MAYRGSHCILAHSSRVQSITAGEAWWQELEAVAHIASAPGKQGETMVFSSLSPFPPIQNLRRSQLGCVFPPQPSLVTPSETCPEARVLAGSRFCQVDSQYKPPQMDTVECCEHGTSAPPTDFARHRGRRHQGRLLRGGDLNWALCCGLRMHWSIWTTGLPAELPL